MTDQSETYLKFWDGCDIKSFYFYFPELPHVTPRMGDCARPVGGEIFIPDYPTHCARQLDSQVEEARAFAEEKWGYTIERDGEHWRFVAFGL